MRLLSVVGLTTDNMERWDFRLIGLIRDGLTGLSSVDLVCELLRSLPYRDTMTVFRMNKQVWMRSRTDPQLRRLMVGKRIGQFVRLYKKNSLLVAISSKDMEAVNGLLDRGYDPSHCDQYAIRWVSNHGWVTVVERLLLDPRVNPGSCRNGAIGWASQEGQVEVVKRLLADRRVDPSDDHNWAIRHAIYNGHTEVVNLLLADPRVADTYTV